MDIHGRWKSEKSKKGYVKHSLKKRLSVTQSLGLQTHSFSRSRGTLQCPQEAKHQDINSNNNVLLFVFEFLNEEQAGMEINNSETVSN